ncbi:Sec1 family protein [Histomonas meleagridis]|uniref:Sec1 family protein n=1 Tax=Histomonas meleagridis TaxID=135588 RepID=UPI003559D933|nr:Sec1 family protein [Histomonas meleagridis]KAH0799299.1 Sec1 family protein [Histomonas meleagridis]
MNAFENISDDTVLLILDRVSDPISALIHPWFYVGAAHELFGIHNNLISIPDKTIVLNERHDTFLKEYGCRFLGEVGPAVADRLREAKRLNDSTKKPIQTAEQIAEFVRTASQLQEQFHIAENHVSLTSAINTKVTDENLISVGELEQSFAVSDDPVIHCREILNLHENNNIPKHEIMKLLLLFALRYEGRAVEQFQQLKEIFPEYVGIMSSITQVAGASKRGADDILAGRNRLTQLFSDIRALYTSNSKFLDQFKCQLTSIIDRVKKGQLSAEQYPFIDGKRAEFLKPKRLIVFYVGGATYYELRAAKEATEIDVVVGGTFVHNSSSFIQYELQPFTK